VVAPGGGGQDQAAKAARSQASRAAQTDRAAQTARAQAGQAAQTGRAARGAPVGRAGRAVRWDGPAVLTEGLFMARWVRLRISCVR
jgi:hypothetical protein